jgi:ABC-type sugar transport system ATPase subunit
MLEVEALSVRAGSFLLRDIHLRVAAGECHAVLGPSGAGKSTLLHAVLGILPPAAGTIRLAGRDLTGLPPEARGLGYVPQRLGLFPHLTVRANLAYSARARRLKPGAFQPLVDRLVEVTGIGALLDRMPATLSGGERQRVGLVRALASRPGLVLLDEPFNALNDGLRREIWQVLGDLRQEHDLAVLMITHDLAEACSLADHTTVLIAGAVHQQGATATVLRQPATPEVARFLAIETLATGRLTAVRDGVATVAVGTASLCGTVPDPPATAVLVCIRGEDVALHLNPGAAQGDNHLPARIERVLPGSPLLRVELDAGFPLVAAVSRRECVRLGLAPGLAVWAAIRTADVHFCPVSAHPPAGDPLADLSQW